jgi:GrpB-like predicted nucleotidyltransferase (UPF0157 family)
LKVKIHAHSDKAVGGDGVMQEPIAIVEYDPNWPRSFDQLRMRLEEHLGNLPVAIEHVGSTAVPGLASKPIIDLDVVVRSSDDVATATSRLELRGYRHEGDLGVTGREAFAPPPPLPRHDHHLYVVVLGSEPYRNHVLLRDYIRAHPEEASRYGDFKRALASRLGHDREAYTEEKSALLEEMLSKAGIADS